MAARVREIMANCRTWTGAASGVLRAAADLPADAALARLDGLIALGIYDKVKLHSMSPADFQSVAQVIEGVAPDEIYNLSGQSSVSLSFTQPAETLAGIALGTLNMLETLRRLGGTVRFYNAGSSECFGDTGTRAANEQTAFRPKSPYGVAKAAAISLVANYRESYGLFACSGLLFNHESPLRPSRFVTRKITAAAARIGAGSRARLALGNHFRYWRFPPTQASDISYVDPLVCRSKNHGFAQGLPNELSV
jgi:GDPmannose 4,6-dehydratase